MSQNKTLRRSVTINPQLDRRLRDFISACMRNGMNMDYTKALNLFAILGERWLEDSSEVDRKSRSETWNLFLDYAKLEDSEALADWYELEQFREWKKAKARLESTTPATSTGATLT